MTFRKILVGLDGSKLSWRALRRALAIAATDRSEVWAISIEELPKLPGDAGEVADEDIRQSEIFERIQGEARELAESLHIRLHCAIGKGTPGQRIVEYARESAVDLIVLGHRGQLPWHRLVGSTADYVVDHASCAVLIERPRYEDEHDLARLLDEHGESS